MQITFTILDPSGTEVTSVAKGGVYTVRVKAFETEANAWIHASVGSMDPLDSSMHTKAFACENAVFSSQVAASHSVKWTAPETTETTNVTISAAQSNSETVPFQTNTV